MEGSKKKRIQTLLGFLVSALALWWVFRSVELDAIWAELKSANTFYLCLAVILTFFSYVLRSLRWPAFFKHNPPQFRDSFRCLILGFFMNNTLPARMGEFVRAHVGGRATNQSRSFVLATIAGERLADGLTISLLFAILFSLDSSIDKENGGALIFYVAMLFFLAGLITAAVLAFRRHIFQWLEYIGSMMPGHVSQYMLVRIQRFIEGLEPLLQPVRLLKITVWSLIVWGVELAVYFLVVRAFHYQESLTFGGVAVFMAAVNFSSLVPSAAGGVGVIELFAKLALEQLGVPGEKALAMVVTQHLIQIAVVGVPGAIFFFSHLRGRVPEDDEDEEEDLPCPKYADVSGPRPEKGEEGDNLAWEFAQQEVDLSVIIPAFNEEDRLPKTLLSVVEYLESRDPTFEVIVVDDGSSDKTAQVVQKFHHLSEKVRLISYQRNRGKGYAVRFGMINARGGRLLYNDADGATPIEELERLEEAIDAGSEIAIGSRAMFSRETNVKTVWYRKFIGRVFNGFVNFMVLPGIADTQCGFKMFVRPAAQYIFSRQRAERFSFDVELLFLARKAGFRIAEVPINWVNVPGSKVNLVKDSIHMGLDICKFRLRDFFGGYRHERSDTSL